MENLFKLAIDNKNVIGLITAAILLFYLLFVALIKLKIFKLNENESSKIINKMINFFFIVVVLVLIATLLITFIPLIKPTNDKINDTISTKQNEKINNENEKKEIEYCYFSGTIYDNDSSQPTENVQIIYNGVILDTTKQNGYFSFRVKKDRDFTERIKFDCQCKGYKSDVINTYMSGDNNIVKRLVKL